MYSRSLVNYDYRYLTQGVCLFKSVRCAEFSHLFITPILLSLQLLYNTNETDCIIGILKFSRTCLMFKFLIVYFVQFKSHFKFIFQKFKTKLFSKSIIENTNWFYICNFLENYTDVMQFKCTMQK